VGVGGNIISFVDGLHTRNAIVLTIFYQFSVK